MSFRHVAEPNIKNLNAQDELCITPPGAPSNLTADAVGDGSFFKLTWSAPTTGGKHYYYEIFVNGSFHSTTRGTKKVIDVSQGVDYSVKVRAVGGVKCKGAFSNTVTFTGGGAPELRPFVYGEWKGASVGWRDITNISGYTIEGFNIYYFPGLTTDVTDLNLEAQVGPGFMAYPKWGLNFGQDVTFGVSYVHDGGQESKIFMDQGAALEEVFREYNVTHTSGIRYFVGGKGSILSVYVGDGQYEATGIKVTSDAEMTLINANQFISKKLFYIRDYFGFWSPDAVYAFWQLRHPFYDDTLEYRLNPGCSVNKTRNDYMGEITQYSDLMLTEPFNLEKKERVGANWGTRIEGGSGTIQGPLCDTPYVKNSWKLIVSNPEEIISEHNVINATPANELYDVSGIEVFRVPSSGSLLSSEVLDSGDVRFTYKTFQGLPYINLYIKPSSNTYGSPYNSSPIFVDGTKMIVSGLSAGEYNAKIDYMLWDQTVFGTSNEVTFTI